MSLFRRGPKKQKGVIVNKGVHVMVPYGWYYFDLGLDLYMMTNDKETVTVTFSHTREAMLKESYDFVNPFTKEEEKLVFIQEGRFVTAIYKGKGFIGKLWELERNGFFLRFMCICKEHLFEPEMDKVMEIVNSMHEISKVEVEKATA